MPDRSLEYQIRDYFAAIANDPRPETLDSTSFAYLQVLEGSAGAPYLTCLLRVMEKFELPITLREKILRQVARLSTPHVESPLQRARVECMVNVIRYSVATKEYLARSALACLVKMRDAAAIDALQIAQAVARPGTLEADRCADALIALEGADLIRREVRRKSLVERIRGWFS